MTDGTYTLEGSKRNEPRAALQDEPRVALPHARFRPAPLGAEDLSTLDRYTRPFTTVGFTRGLVMSTITQRRRVSPLAILALCLASLAASATALFAQDPPAPVVVFGDSYSDPGNGFTFVKTSSTPPDYGLNALLIPDAP